MIETIRNEKEVEKNIVKVYQGSCQLKETYNECQYYMSHNELKLFYEESFFSVNTLCVSLQDYVKTKSLWRMPFLKFNNAVYITKLTIHLFFTEDEFKWLFSKALLLEERNFKILEKLQNIQVSEELNRILASEYNLQQNRIRTLKSILKEHYS
ncbi:hypothetical protein HX109_08035 [Galbibacter sp. BG1]|uniref:hypothetical protein n=1 Tax=Galbibacter sp. BG1 TaxID=1170699 RepID=UPI0015B8C5F6|nr:hypothetical protein [Galbibacter sp. BG1]QLE01516.1 hypothetical protein HX109_08035 [Galbibacter sp. BG1]